MKFARFVLLISIGLAGCREREQSVPDDSPPEWNPLFFAPRVGEKWIYRETNFQLNDRSLRPVPDSAIEKSVSERVKTYQEVKHHEGEVLHRFEVAIDGKFAKGFFFHWDGTHLTVKGTINRDGREDFSSDPVPIADIHLTPGAFWHWPLESPRDSGFQVIGFESVTVPAGIFEGYKITYQSQPKGNIVLKDYWFVPRVGIVKEESRTYRGGLLDIHTIIELERREAPE